MNRAPIAAALAAFCLLSACHKDIQTTDAVQRGVMKYLSTKSGLSTSSMDISVTSVSFRGNEADAVVHFQAKGSNDASSGINMKYILERSGSEWVVKGRAGSAAGGANPHGGMGAMPPTGAPALPPGHPAIPPQSK